MQLPLVLERYTVFRELAWGGMATVYLARIRGAAGFGRTVAVKRLHPHLASDEELVSRFVDEARVAAYIHHPNVVPTLDVITHGSELFLVLEYVTGDSLAGLVSASIRAGANIPVSICLFIATGVLNGLHAAHEAKDEKGNPIHIVHRDVSPQNILVGVDGIARVLDFGIAKAANRLSETTYGVLKGKIPYMAPEQLTGAANRKTDIYSAGVVLWEMLSGRGLFRKESELLLMNAILWEEILPPSAFNPSVPPEVDRIIMKALSRDASERYETAHAMAEDVDGCLEIASALKVAEWVQTTAAVALAVRSKLVSEVESLSLESLPPRILSHLP
ncbi:MAG TPA: serine/threonine-protein kinase [Polyangiaceae bacterium]|nr:serine/threonine-protein kinase [Polyangiaceae bacterium]